MNKKEKLTLIAVGLMVFFISCFSVSLLMLSNNNKEEGESSNASTSSKPAPAKDGTIKVGKYTLHYGNYYCEYEEYDDGKLIMKEAILELDEDEITIGDEDYEYAIEGDELKLKEGPILRVVKDDRIRVEAGAGLEYNYKEAK